MNKFTNFLKACFTYTPNVKYNFVLEENNANSKDVDLPDSFLPDHDVFESLDKNYEYIKVQYNSLINSDIIIRPFTLNILGKKYSALFVGIDGMIDSELVNNFLLRPLMETNSSFKPAQTKSGVEYKKIKKVSIEDYIFDKLLPQNSVQKVSKFSEVASAINSGNCALFIDTVNIAFSIDVKGFAARGIDTPKNEIVVRGSQEAFVEKLRTNTSILRRLINTPDLIIESTTVGKANKTQVAVCYMKNIANSSLISEVKYRLANLDVDYVISSRKCWTAYTRW